MNIKLDYDKLASICLTADGGYCSSCASDVAEGFKEYYPEINLKKLEDFIDKKMDVYYEETNKKIKKSKKTNGSPMLPIFLDQSITDVAGKKTKEVNE